MRTIGIVGRGFVGNAIFEGMKHAFDVRCYDASKGFSITCGGVEADGPEHDPSLEPLQWMAQETDGPIFICLPTPMRTDGSCNTDIVESVVKALDACIVFSGEPKRVLIIKSTVVPGTTEKINDWCRNFHVCYNPEFLREATYLDDFKNQDRIVIGGPHGGTKIVKQMYETAYPDVQVTKTSSTIAELVKYFTNCFLAVKVSFANEMKELCDKLEVDYDKVVEYGTKDKRVGNSHWSVPGPDGLSGFGGSCFPKDLNALMRLACSLEVPCETMLGAWNTNLRVRPERDWEQLKGRAVDE
jgi:UDPglucose 6-dehydrogenase